MEHDVARLNPLRPCLGGRFLAKNLLPFQLFPRHITLNTPKDGHIFEAVNVGKKITNYTVLMYFATRIF
jgi:hypothetical protein